MKKITKVLLTIMISFSLLYALPLNVNAETLQDYIDQVNKYEKEVQDAENQIKLNQSQIAQAQSEINNIIKEIKNMGIEIEKMKEEIIEYNQEIKDTSLETKQLFQYLQIANGENIYLEYAYEANTITDLIYRLAIVEQLTEYNNQTIEKLEGMIEANKKREQELNQKEINLKGRQTSLTKKISELNGAQKSLNQTSVSSSQQVKIYQDIVKRYKDAGCKPSDVIGVDCAKTSSAVGFFRPIERGYVTSEFGYRWGTLHQGMDVSNNDPYHTKIYPVANGTISAKYIDYYGALVIAIEHYYNGKYYTSLYAHMSSYAPGLYVGKNVTTNDYIGIMGETGLAYGPHLHLELADCRLYNAYDKNCGTWDKYVNYQNKLANNGSKGARDLIYFPGVRVSWNTRY